MKSTGQVFGLALCLLTASLCPGQTKSQDWASGVSRTKTAVVLIETDRGLGSGFLGRPKGTLVKHVISGATQIAVTFVDVTPVAGLVSKTTRPA